MTDKIVEAVRQDLLDRSQVGMRKYGTTLDDDATATYALATAKHRTLALIKTLEEKE